MLQVFSDRLNRDSSRTMLDDKTVLMTFREQQVADEVAIVIHREAYAIDAENTRSIIIGRESTNFDGTIDIDLGIHGGLRMGVSRQHLAVKLINNNWTIMDLGSRNGTALSGIILEPEIAYVIPNETRIFLGNMIVNLYLN